MKPFNEMKEPENVEVRFIFVNHPTIRQKLAAIDAYSAASQAMELTCNQWPVQRPICIRVWSYSQTAGVDLVCYRVTKDWRLLEEPNPYTTLIKKET